MPQAAFVATVSGRVQMVMYRDFAQRKARSLGIVGEVANLPDGTVRVAAEGPREQLHAFLELLKQGPFFAEVENLAVEWREPSGAFRGFSIHYEP